MGPIVCPQTMVTNYQSISFTPWQKPEIMQIGTNILEKSDVSTLYCENIGITHFKTLVPIHQATWLNTLQGHNLNKLDFNCRNKK
jgi:hypothetical protein